MELHQDESTSEPAQALIRASGEPPEVDMSPMKKIPLAVLPELLQMRKLFGAMLPPDIIYESYKTGNLAIDASEDMAFKCSYDEGYCGHFSIPSTDGAAADFTQVSAQEDMMPFIEKHLVFPVTMHRYGVGESELVIHSGGLNTFHAVKPPAELEWQYETTTPERLQHYIDSIGCPMAQLHMGTDMDQGAVEIEASDELLEYFGAIQPQLEMTALSPEIDGNTVKFGKRQRDRLEALFSTYGYARPLWQDHMVALLRANETANKQLVFMPYSRSTSEMASALRRYISEYVESAAVAAEVAKVKVEALLLQTVTVVTIGNTDRNWPDGPAYVHVSGKSAGEGPRGTDMTVIIQGVHSGSPEGAGKGAVFLHSDWVFSGFDAHNFAAAGGAVLRLTMAMNGVSRWRELWERLSAGKSLRLPSYEEAAAGTVLVGGKKWLWFAEQAMYGVQLPSDEEAQTLVGQWMGGAPKEEEALAPAEQLAVAPTEQEHHVPKKGCVIS